MARDDKYYSHVKEALFKDGWTITHDPLRLKVDATEFKIDLGAERVVLNFKNKVEEIAVEIKSFPSKSFMNDWHHARGQYADYRDVLASNEKHAERKLYIAVPEKIYEKNFNAPFIIEARVKENMGILVFDVTLRRVVKWIK